MLECQRVDDAALEVLSLNSLSITHYLAMKNVKVNYGEHYLNTRQCDIVKTRIKLGYRYLWQVNKPAGLLRNVARTKCKICQAPYSHDLRHYIAFCPPLEDFRPEGLSYYDLCAHFMKGEIIDAVLNLYPEFASPWIWLKGQRMIVCYVYTK